MGAFKVAMDVYMSYKFGGLLSSNLQLIWLNCYSSCPSALGLFHLRSLESGTFVLRYTR